MRVLMVGFWDPYLLDLTERLIENGLEIPTIIGYQAENYRKRERLKDLEIFDNQLFYHPKRIRNLNVGQPAKLGAADYETFAPMIRDYITYSDRLSFFPKSVRFRRLLAYELIEYWNRFFEQRNFDAVLMDAAPHMGWDNLLYAVAKQRKLEVIHIQLSTISERVLILDRFKDLPQVPGGYLSGAETTEIRDGIPEDVYADLERVSPWLAMSYEINDKVLGKTSFFRKLPRWSDIRKRLGHFRRITALLFKPFDLSAFYFDRTYRYATLWLFMRRLYREKNALKSRYESLVKSGPMDANYAIFGMHYQPEMASSTITNGFDDQVLAITILSAALPEGWTLYVKEHPAQFQTGMRAATTRHYRDTQDYERLESLKNVKLVPLEKNSSDLIRNAKFVSTLTGTMAWEAMTRGKPAIIFGDPPYVPCRACRRVGNVEEARIAIEEMTRIPPEKIRQEVLRYLSYSAPKLIKAADSQLYSERSETSPDRQLANLTAGILSELGRVTSANASRSNDR